MSVDDCYRLVQVTAWSLLVVTGQFLTFYCVLQRTAVTCSGVSYVARCFLLVSCGTSDTQQLRVCGKVVTVKSLYPPSTPPIHTPVRHSDLGITRYGSPRDRAASDSLACEIPRTPITRHVSVINYLLLRRTTLATYVRTYIRNYVLRSFWVSRKGKCRKKELAESSGAYFVHTEIL